jgi:hypothetical protein
MWSLKKVGRRDRVQAPVGEPHLPGLGGDGTRLERQVTRDSDRVGAVHEGCVRRTINVRQHCVQARHHGDVCALLTDTVIALLGRSPERRPFFMRQVVRAALHAPPLPPTLRRCFSLLGLSSTATAVSRQRLFGGAGRPYTPYAPGVACRSERYRSTLPVRRLPGPTRDGMLTGALWALRERQRPHRVVSALAHD